MAEGTEAFSQQTINLLRQERQTGRVARRFDSVARIDARPLGDVTVAAATCHKVEKPDPYETPFHRRLDAALVLVTVLIFALLWRSSERGQDTLRSESDATRAQLHSTWATVGVDPRVATNTHSTGTRGTLIFSGAVEDRR